MPLNVATCPESALRVSCVVMRNGSHLLLITCQVPSSACDAVNHYNPERRNQPISQMAEPKRSRLLQATTSWSWDLALGTWLWSSSHPCLETRLLSL